MLIIWTEGVLLFIAINVNLKVPTKSAVDT